MGSLDNAGHNVYGPGPEPMAIVGMGCHMPGGVRSPSDLWKLIMSRVIANTDRVPKSRFNMDAYLHPSNERPGSFNVSGGYFLDESLEEFDPGVFKISQVEALCLDPQQRKLLEVVYEAFENSGTTLEEAAGRKMGCFVGSFTHDFMHMTLKEPDFRHTYNGVGIDFGMLANRISYAFDLKGPSLSLNTACSSSLYALDLACKAIAAGQCDSAIVGGVNLILSVDQQMNTARLGVLSPTNQCHTFDAAADGYTRADGVGALYVKPLSAAIRDGDPIRAVIRSTAVGSNGKNKDGITHPSVEGQMEVIATAYRRAGLSPDQTAYVECHGTGTPVGDPLELEAIHKAMGNSPSRESPILVGSIKPNIGHSEAASSMGTLIKAIMALENGMLPPTAGLTKLNPAIPWNDLNLKVVTEPTSWPSPLPLRRIGVNAFGYAGTNAHAILESIQSMVPRGYHGHKFVSPYRPDAMTNGHSGWVDDVEDRSHLLVFTAHDDPTLKNNLADYATRCSDAPLLDLAYTLGVRRTKLSRRAFAIAKRGAIQSAIAGATANITSAPSKPACPAFVFTGQGAQWPRMGAELMRLYPQVLDMIRRLDRHLSRLASPPSWTIEEALQQPAETSIVNDAEYAQPLTTAVQIAVVSLLSYWGVRPLATVGHSSGEIAAAFAAGRISAEDAIAAAYFRGKVVGTLQAKGAMLAVGLGAEQVTEAYLDREDAPWRGSVVVACHNSPSAVTLSGNAEAIEQLRLALSTDQVFVREVRTGGKAYHSPLMKEAATHYQEFLGRENSSGRSSDHTLPRAPMFSTVKTAQVEHEQMPWSYWAANLISPVLFEQGVALMLRELTDINMLVEIGPHSALSGPLRQICQAAGKGSSVEYLPTMRRGAHDGDQILTTAGALWARDAPINMERVTSLARMSDGCEGVETKTGTLLVDLPPYHWTYSAPCWAESRISREQRQATQGRHDTLGRRLVNTSALEPTWRNVLRQKDLPWLCQHTVAGEVLMPGCGHIATAIEALTQINEQSDRPVAVRSYTLRDVVISAATVVPDNDETGTETLFHMQPVDGKPGSRWYQFTASCYSYGSWKETVRGRIGLNIVNAPPRPKAFPETPRRDEHIKWLDKLRSTGIDLGPAFHHIGEICTTDSSHSASGDMAISQTCGLMEGESRYVLHPTVIDSCLQPVVPTIHKGHLDSARCGTVPVEFGEVTIFVPTPEQLSKRCLLQVWTPELANRAFSSNVQLLDADGSVLVTMADCRGMLYEAAVPHDQRAPRNRDLYIRQNWSLDIDYVDSQSEIPSVAAMVDLLLHKDSKTRTLCLDPSLVPTLLAVRPRLMMDIAASSKEARESLLANYGDYEDLEIIDLDVTSSSSSGSRKEAYDLIISVGVEQEQVLDGIMNMLAPAGHLLLQKKPPCKMEGGRSRVCQPLADGGVLVTAAEEPGTDKIAQDGKKKTAVLVYPDTPTSSLYTIVSRKLESQGWKIRSQPLGSLDPIVRDEDRVIMLDEDAEHGTVLAQLKEDHLRGLIHLTESAASITWVTAGGLLTGDRPVYGLTTGAARVIRTERGAQLDLVTLDFDIETTTLERVASLVADIVKRQHEKGRNGEIEYWLKANKVHIGRLVPHTQLNREFVVDSGETTTLHPRDGPIAVRGSLDQVTGQLKYCHDQREAEAEPLQDDQVEVKVEAIGITTFDAGDDSSHLSHQMAGTVTRVGEKVDASHLVPGARVFGLAFDGQLATVQRTPSSLVQVLPPDCSAVDAASIPSAFSNAIYGLEELGRVEPGEHVAILDGMGAVGLAAVQLCHVIGAVAVVVTSSEQTERVLAENKLVGPSCRVISIRPESSLRDQVEEALAGESLDVVMGLASADTSFVLESIRTSISPFARIVSITSGAEKTWTTPLSSKGGLSWLYFDLKHVAAQRRRVMARVLERCGKLYREGEIRPIQPIAVTEPAAVGEALQHGKLNEMGSEMPVVSYGPDATFKVSGPSRPPLRFREDATYLLVGCLGGLGQHVALRMADKGAKYLVFLSRSGADKPDAARTVESIRAQGVNVLVLRADVAKQDDLRRAMTELRSREDFPPIRGVLNAAVFLNDRVFNNMTVDTWQGTVDTKMLGSLNLHQAFPSSEPLDFFVMTSSVASALGASGQSNYAAGNAFMDTLALHRRSRGMPGISLVLPAILDTGYIAEHADIKRGIQSRGLAGIGKDEMLEAFDVAMTPQSSPRSDDDDHIIVGIQPQLYGRALHDAQVSATWDDDPHYNWMAMEIGKLSFGGESSAARSSGQKNIKTAIRESASREAAAQTVTEHVARRLARLMMLDEAKVIEGASSGSVASHGLDSMIGAEFRNWIFREFGFDVPFQQLLAGSLTISELGAMLCTKVIESETS